MSTVRVAGLAACFVITFFYALIAASWLFHVVLAP